MLWLTVYRKILDDKKPFEPLKLFKYAPIVMYNKAKGGVDKATELEERVQCNYKSYYETKYIFRMLVACVVNAWRVWQAIQIKDHLQGTITLKQIRRMLGK